jgi:hypothetical protein
MALLLLLLSIFALWGIGSGSSSVSTSPTTHVSPQIVTKNSQRAPTTCKKVRIKGASGQARRCIYVPVNR